MKHATSATESPRKATIDPSCDVVDVESAQRPARGRKLNPFKKGDRAQVICPPDWEPLTYAKAGSRGTVQRTGKGRLRRHVFVVLDEPPYAGARCDVCLPPDRVALAIEITSWNESEDGQSFWHRVALIEPFLLPQEKHCGYFERSLNYPRSFHWLEQLEARRQLTLPLEPTPEEQIAAIRREGPIAPDGVWIETGKVSGKAFRQAWYRSRSPCFTPARKGDALKKSQYLGAVGGDRHKEAVKAIERRNKIKKLKKQVN